MGVMPGEPPRVPIPAYNTAGEILKSLIGSGGYGCLLGGSDREFESAL